MAGGRLIQALGAVPRVLVWDGQAAIGRWRRGRSELTAATQAFRGTLATKVVICRPADPEAKAWSSGPTASWRLPSCPGAASLVRPISTPSWPHGPRPSTAVSGGCWAAPQPSESMPTGPPCCRCRRSRRPPGSGPRCGCRATTTCAWTATTTRSTRPQWAAASSWPPTWSASRSAAMGGWSLTTPAAGLGSKPSLILRTWTRPARSAGSADRPATDADPVQQRSLADYDAAFGLGEGAV